MIETQLEQCQRHVSQGAERIARQEALLARLERDGHEHMLPDARTLLTALQATQRLGEEHLAREVAKGE